MVGARNPINYLLGELIMLVLFKKLLTSCTIICIEKNLKPWGRRSSLALAHLSLSIPLGLSPALVMLMPMHNITLPKFGFLFLFFFCQK